MRAIRFSSSGGGSAQPQPAQRQTPLVMWPVMHAGKPTSLSRGQNDRHM